jgi:hypothetical protein
VHIEPVLLADREQPDRWHFTTAPPRPKLEESTMLRKIALAAVAAASLGAAALAPAPASAAGWHHGWHGGWHHGWAPRARFGVPVYYGGYGNCHVRRLAPTPWGLRWRIVNRCY